LFIPTRWCGCLCTHPSLCGRPSGLSEKNDARGGRQGGAAACRQGPTGPELQLQEIFTLMGEEWVNTGEHFIPLHSGGQIHLKAESFPIVNLSNGKRIIVDLHDELPERMAQVITSNWENYRVAHLQDRDDLRGALDRIFPLCEFHRLYRSGEPLELVSDIRLQITADWIIFPSPTPKEEESKPFSLTSRIRRTQGSPMN
jgi:hypothetical protein